MQSQKSAHPELEHEHCQFPDGKFCLKNENYSANFEQFLKLAVQVKQEEDIQDNASGSPKEIKRKIPRTRKSKPSPSIFHNFQKHLINCLKGSIDISQETTPSAPPAALQLWNDFKKSSTCSKKILHYIFGENNQHQITDYSLRSCQLINTYQSFPEQTIREARVYLTKQALRQIRNGKVVAFIKQNKIKHKSIFEEYVNIFAYELESGFLTKRLPRETLLYLQKNN